MNAVGASILVILAVVVWSAPPRWVSLGMMAAVLYLPEAQQLVVGGVNLFGVRILGLVAFLRAMARREFSFTRLNSIDKAVLLLYTYKTVVHWLRSTEDWGSVVGPAVDVWFCYFTFRGLVGDLAELRWFLRSFLILLAPFAALVLVESLTGHNSFAFMGAKVAGDNWMRGDRFRCFGSFGHPSLLGTLGASFLPLYLALAFTRAERTRACIGLILCLAIVFASNSGGPLNTAAVGVVGWFLWRVRRNMRQVRWGIVGLLVMLALVMKAPIWYLPARFSQITGGDGWHRSYLLDVSFQHFSQWWFAGMSLKDTKGWFPYDLDGTGGADITNQFIALGLGAGLGAIVLFVVLLTRAFSSLGKALAFVRLNSAQVTQAEFMLWGLGVMLVAHIANWQGITYFDQTYVIWCLQLAAISSLSESCTATSLISMEGTAEAEDAVEDSRHAPMGETI